MNIAKQFNPTIITGCPSSGYERAAEQKRIWIAKHFGDIPVITCMSRDKQLHMSNKGDVLVDDTLKNIKRWEEAGGVGLHYTDPKKDLEKLKQLMQLLTGIDQND